LSTDRLRSRRNGDRERGAVLVETVLVVPLLFALCFGLIDFGNDYNNWVAVRQGTRESLRQALIDTSPTAPAGGWNCPIISANAPASGTDGYAMICFTKNQIGLDQRDTRVKISFDPPYKAGKPVKVCVQYRSRSLTGAYSTLLNNRAMSASAESLIETSQADFTAPVAETPITSWPASCSTL
jgi:Flp pilus assembly protein TadG